MGPFPTRFAPGQPGLLFNIMILRRYFWQRRPGIRAFRTSRLDL